MSQIISSQHLEVSSSNTSISFETEGGGSWPRWWRWLMLEGKKAYFLGNICDTCDFMFERHEGANKKIEVESLKEVLQEGVSELTTPLIGVLETILPKGSYEALLVRTLLQPAPLGTKSDYFANEQIDNSGLDSFWGMPHHPKIPYYRAGTVSLSDYERLFEFVIPMFPRNWLNKESVAYYRKRLSQSSCPTAVAISVLDVKTPSSSPKEGNGETHYCLAHYLLDGHHKIEAAAQENRPVSILSFLADDKGVCSPDQIQTVLSVLHKN
jgi:hypothetical protein